MLAVLNSLNAHTFSIFQPILMILVSKFMVYRTLFGKTYFSLGLLSPLILSEQKSGHILFILGQVCIHFHSISSSNISLTPLLDSPNLIALFYFAKMDLKDVNWECFVCQNNSFILL